MSGIVICESKAIGEIIVKLSLATQVSENAIRNDLILLQNSAQVNADKLRTEMSAFAESLNLLSTEVKVFHDQVFYDEGESYRPRFGIQGLLYRYDPKAKHSEKKAMKGHKSVLVTRKQFMQLKTFKNFRFERKWHGKQI